MSFEHYIQEKSLKALNSQIIVKRKVWFLSQRCVHKTVGSSCEFTECASHSIQWISW